MLQKGSLIVMRIFFWIVLSLILAIVTGCRSAPIYNAEHIAISPRVSATDEDISEAIWSAGRRLGWQVNKIRPGEMQATIDMRSHSATVKILYNHSIFSIHHISSKNLDEDDGEIHENYNIWIKRLEKKIQDEISFRLP
jgi:hypothetical protein